MTDPDLSESNSSYDEFGLFHENIHEFGLPESEPPTVRRVDVALDDDPGRSISALVWGTMEPQLVLIHGGSQNAHTWDTVALALGLSLVAIDMPGHGRSGWREDGAYTPTNLAEDVAVAVRELAPKARAVVGMSLGGLMSIELASNHPELVRNLLLVDVTPGVNREKAQAIIDFVNGPQSFASFDDLLARTMEHNPTRSESSLRRGILHNAHRADNGEWRWNYDRREHARSGEQEPGPTDPSFRAPLWDHLELLTCPVTLLRGSLSPVVDDDDVAELVRRQPKARVEVVAGAGHSIQGDRPVELAALLREIVL